MSILPLTFASKAYIGAPFKKPIELCRPVTQEPSTIPLDIYWANYGASLSNSNIAINVPLQAGAIALLESIRGVFIDNTGSNATVYVYFPDTECLVVCQPFAELWSPVFSNGVNCLVLGRGFTDGDQSRTKIFLLNVPVQPGANAEINNVYPQFRASPQLSRGTNVYTTGFDIPAIGDQIQTYNSGFTGTQTDLALFGTPYTAGLITLVSAFVQYRMPSNGVLSSQQVNLALMSTGPSGTIWSSSMLETANGLATGSLLWSADNMQVKLSAAESWVLRLSSAAALAINGRIHATFTYSLQTQGGGVFSTGTFLQTQTGALFLNSSTPYGGLRFVAPSSARVTSVQLAVDPSASYSGSYHIEIRSNSAGNPGTLLGSSLSITPIITALANREATFTFATPVSITSGTTYWVCVVPDAPLTASLSIPVCAAVSGYAAGRSAAIATIGSGALAGGVLWRLNVNYQIL